MNASVAIDRETINIKPHVNEVSEYMQVWCNYVSPVELLE